MQAPTYLVPVPGHHVHPAHLASALPGIAEATLLRLRASARLEGRLSSLLAERLGLPDLPEGAAGSPAERLALQRPEALHHAARLMGAAWHARSVCACIRGDEVACLAAGIGSAAHRFALRNRDLAVAAPLPVPAAELVAAIGVAATGCLANWLAGLPPALRARAAVKLSPALAAVPLADAPPDVMAELVGRAAKETLDGAA